MIFQFTLLNAFKTQLSSSLKLDDSILKSIWLTPLNINFFKYLLKYRLNYWQNPFKRSTFRILLLCPSPPSADVLTRRNDPVSTESVMIWCQANDWHNFTESAPNGSHWPSSCFSNMRNWKCLWTLMLLEPFSKITCLHC